MFSHIRFNIRYLYETPGEAGCCQLVTNLVVLCDLNEFLLNLFTNCYLRVNKATLSLLNKNNVALLTRR